jgi:hypothetical protein
MCPDNTPWDYFLTFPANQLMPGGGYFPAIPAR